MYLGAITWIALLASIGQLDARVYLNVSQFDSHRGYHVVVRGFKAMAYDPRGKVLGSATARSITVGERAFWYLTPGADDLCSISFSGAVARKCVSPPKHPGEMSGLKFFGGGVYFFVDSFRRVQGRVGHYYDLIRMDEATHELHAVSRDHFFSGVPRWCLGDGLEYMYLNDASAGVGGVKKFTLPGEDRMNVFLPESCAVNGHDVAVADSTHLIVNGQMTSIPASGLVFPFKDGWLVQTGSGFKLYSSGGHEMESGSMESPLMLYYDSDKFFLLNFGRHT
jgi:hypothetical protein